MDCCLGRGLGQGPVLGVMSTLLRDFFMLRGLNCEPPLVGRVEVCPMALVELAGFSRGTGTPGRRIGSMLICFLLVFAAEGGGACPKAKEERVGLSGLKTPLGEEAKSGGFSPLSNPPGCGVSIRGMSGVVAKLRGGGGAMVPVGGRGCEVSGRTVISILMEGICNC